MIRIGNSEYTTRFKTWLNMPPPILESVSRGKRSAIVGHLNDLFGGDDNRHKFLRWAFGVESSKRLSDAQLCRLYAWLGPQCIDDVWIVRAQAIETAKRWLMEKGAE